jgi:glycosyltransferase involved in cell wall biosynthesis
MKPASKAGPDAVVWAVYASDDTGPSALFRELSRRVPLHSVLPSDGLPFLSRWAPPPQPRTRLRVMPWGAPLRRLHTSILRRHTRNARAVIFTRPDQEVLLDAFPDTPRLYFAKDDYRHYFRNWDDQEERLLRAVHRIAAVSLPLAQLLAQRGGHPPSHARAIPNGVDADFIPGVCPAAPAAFPEGLQPRRPVAGILGRVSSRLRLDWLDQAIAQTPWLHWMFVGEVEDAELRPEDRPTLQRLLRHPRCTFTGWRSFEDLSRFAGSFDVGVMPYSEASLNPFASPRRLFLHLPFGAPVLATPGCAQLDEFSSLVDMCGSVGELVATLERLRAVGFDDGRREERWRAVQLHTWTHRAAELLELIEDAERVSPGSS